MRDWLQRNDFLLREATDTVVLHLLAKVGKDGGELNRQFRPTSRPTRFAWRSSNCHWENVRHWALVLVKRSAFAARHLRRYRK